MKKIKDKKPKKCKHRIVVDYAQPGFEKRYCRICGEVFTHGTFINDENIFLS